MIVSSWCTILCGGTGDGKCERIGTSQSIQCVLLTGNRSGVICIAFSLAHCHPIMLFGHTDADPGVQVSNLDYDMDNNRLSWTPIPLIEARHFFNYTITATPSSSSTRKRQIPSVMVVPYSYCGDICSVQPTLSPDTNYSVTVAITRSTNVGATSNDDPMSCDIVYASIFILLTCFFAVKISGLIFIGPTTTTPNSNVSMWHMLH